MDKFAGSEESQGDYSNYFNPGHAGSVQVFIKFLTYAKGVVGCVLDNTVFFIHSSGDMLPNYYL